MAEPKIDATIAQIKNELTVCYEHIGRKAPESLPIIAASLQEAIGFSDPEQVHRIFVKAKDIESIPTQKTLKECLRNYGEEYLKYQGGAGSDTAAIEYTDPRAAWLPKEPLLQKINFHESAKRYCIAIDRLNGNDKAYAGFRNAYAMTKDGSRYVYVRPDAARAYDEMMRGTLTRIYERFWRLLPMAKGYPANMPVTLGVCPPSVAEYMEMFRRERKNAG